jgi:hypothetical protein
MNHTTSLSLQVYTISEEATLTETVRNHATNADPQVVQKVPVGLLRARHKDCHVLRVQGRLKQNRTASPPSNHAATPVDKVSFISHMSWMTLAEDLSIDSSGPACKTSFVREPAVTA